MCYCIDGTGMIFRFVNHLVNFVISVISWTHFHSQLFSQHKNIALSVINILLFPEHMELTKQLQSLPIRCDTLRVQNRRSELENKLAEIDDAIRIFSRPKVFVKLSS